jgi:hypothetical protein
MNLKQISFAVAALLYFTQLAEAQSFNQLVGFGDSTVDTGWYTGVTSGAHATGVLSTDNSIAASLAAGGNAHPTGPGLGNAQLLAGFFGLSVNSASQAGGTNFAIGKRGGLSRASWLRFCHINRKSVSEPVAPGHGDPDQQLFGVGERPRQSKRDLCAGQRWQ